MKRIRFAGILLSTSLFGTAAWACADLNCKLTIADGDAPVVSDITLACKDKCVGLLCLTEDEPTPWTSYANETDTPRAHILTRLEISSDTFPSGAPFETQEFSVYVTEKAPEWNGVSVWAGSKIAPRTQPKPPTIEATASATLPSSNSSMSYGVVCPVP